MMCRGGPIIIKKLRVEEGGRTAVATVEEEVEVGDDPLSTIVVVRADE